MVSVTSTGRRGPAAARQLVAADVGSVYPGGGLHQPVPVLGNQGAALAGQHPDGFLVDQLAPQPIAFLGIGRRRHQLVTTTTSPSRSHGAALATAVLAGGTHGVTPASCSPALTISAVAAGSVIISGTARTATPSMSAWSSWLTSQQSRIPVPRRAP